MSQTEFLEQKRKARLFERVQKAARHKIPVELALLLFAFIVLGSLTLASAILSLRTAEDRKQSDAVQSIDTDLRDLLLALRRAESGQRGYLLTGDKEFLGSYDEIAKQAADGVAALESGFIATPFEAIYRQVQTKVRQKLAEMGKTLELYEAGQRQQSLALVRGGTGRELMDDIGQEIALLQGELGRQLQRKLEATHRLEAILFFLNILGAILVVVLASISMYLFWRANKDMQSAQNELRAINENLESIVAERVEDVREANEEIQRFAYIVSHDLRSPLVNIMGFTSELEALGRHIFPQAPSDPGSLAPPPEPKPPVDELRTDFSESIGFIKSSIGKMDRLISAILKISREGSRPFRPETIDMSGLLRSIADSMTHQTQAANAVVTIEALPRLESDKLALEQIFSNLLDNALKFLRPEEPGRVIVSSKRLGRKIEFEVRDNGRGIDDKDKSRIFELFRRAGQQDRPGEGMGLAHTLTLVRRLDGAIRVESEPGKGSSFFVTFPATWSAQNTQRMAA